MMDFVGVLVTVGVVLVVFLVVFLACRRVSLWYFRINETITLLERIHTELRKSNGAVVVDG